MVFTSLWKAEKTPSLLRREMSTGESFALGARTELGSEAGLEDEWVLLVVVERLVVMSGEAGRDVVFVRLHTLTRRSFSDTLPFSSWPRAA